MFHKNTEVTERLKKRKTGEKDSYKIGLIIEGGGMRGIFGAGVCVGLTRQGLNDCFDYIYSSSSGACSGALFLTGQGEQGLPIYYEHLNGFKFIKPWRLNKIMDLDYLFDSLYRDKHYLDAKKLRNCKTELKVFVSNSENGQCEYFSNHDDADFFQVLKASCALPFFYGQSININDSFYMDGNIGKALPIENALTDGCTDLLVILTVPEHYRKSKKDYARNMLNYIGQKKFGSRFRRLCDMDIDNYNESLDAILGKTIIHRDINIYVISPDFKLNNLEVRTKMLKQAARKGIKAAEYAFKGRGKYAENNS